MAFEVEKVIYPSTMAVYAGNTGRIDESTGQAPDAIYAVQTKTEKDPAEKMKAVDWPGAISVFHGHNWGEDDKYPIAIKEAFFVVGPREDDRVVLRDVNIQASRGVVLHR